MKNKKVMRNGCILLITIVMSLLTSTVLAQGGGADFTGTWSLNEGKSDMGKGRMRFAASSLVIMQQANNLSIERTSATPDGSTTTSSEQYTLDGRTNTNTGRMGMPLESTVTRTSNGSTLTFNSSQTIDRGGQSMEIKTTEVWSLSTDGNTMTIHLTTSTQQGDMERTLVYDKK